jgi:hypothetical protein
MLSRISSRLTPRLCLVLGVLSFCWASAGSATAAPEITNLSLHGLQTGATTTLTIDGSDLLPNPRVVLPLATTAQVVKAGATPNRVQIAVTLPAGVSPGMAPLRVANSKGISSPVLIGIDDLPQIPFAAQVSAPPAALNGNLPESDTLQTTFPGRKGQRIVIDIEARRLGSVIDPVIDLYDARRVQLAWSQGQSALGGDARLEAILPADGTYTVDLHDILYRAGSPNHFRLKIGTLSYADLVFPLGGRYGTETTFEPVGSEFPPGTQVKVDLRKAVGDLPLPLPARPGVIGPAPRIFVSEFPEILKATPAAGKLQEVTVPAIINGRLDKPQEEDRYRLLVKPGMRLRFDVLANRAGSPLDGTLTIQNEAGATLAESDDRDDTIDPGLEFTVPARVNALVVTLKDVEGRGGPKFVYRLSVTPADHPDFRLEVFQDRHALPQGDVAVVRVRAERFSYSGPIKLSVVGLPADVVKLGDVIPAGATDTLLSLLAPAGPSPSQGLFHIVGASTDPKITQQQTALMPLSTPTQRQPWLRSVLGFALTDASPIRVAWEKSDPLFAVGSSYPVRVQLTRAAGATGSVRLSLLTSQVVPRTPDGMREDLNRALRFEGSPMIAANQKTGGANVIVPGDLPLLPYDLAIQAELLAADGRTVLATAVTPSRRLQASQPFTLQLTSPATVQAKSGSGPTGKLTGKVVRAGGFNKAVTVSLTGLPPELPAPMVMVPGDRNDFELPVAFPYETKLGPLPNVKLVASSSISSQRTFTSNEFAVAVQVVKGEPPPPAPALYRVFEDEPNFVALLYEGDGQVELETVDRYSGSAALRVTGNQRFRTKMPGWGYKIAAQPGAGEFRYLRFAWKKRGGSNIMLQINANGQWGPGRGKPGPSFRYEAGPGDNPFMAAALKVDSRLPDDWVVVTRDLFADFGSFVLTGIAFTPGPGEYGLFDHVYLARNLEDFKGCPTPVPPQQPRMVFEDQKQFLENLLEGAGTATLDATDKYSGKVSIKVTPDQRFNERMPGLGVRIRQNPSFGEYRFLRFAWKKKGGQTICLQLNHDGQWGPTATAPGKFRYHAGPGGECYGASIAVDDKIPSDWVVVTRDLYADFGEFTWTGIALSPVDGDYALFDHVYLGKTTRDFELVKPKPAAGAK